MPSPGPDADRGADHLRFAAATGNVDTVRALITAGADVNAASTLGLTLLHLAAGGGHDAVVQLLLQHGADVAAGDCDGESALRIAACNGHTAVVRALLSAGADVDAGDVEGSTPLHVSTDEADIVRLLLDHGADANIQDRWGATPLRTAARRGNNASVETLIANGADVRIRTDGKEWTCLDLAYVHDRSDTMRLLVKHGAEVENGFE